MEKIPKAMCLSLSLSLQQKNVAPKQGWLAIRLLEEYRKNLKYLAKILRKRAAGKRIIWLSCAAQGNLTTTTRFTQTQAIWGMAKGLGGLGNKSSLESSLRI